MQASLALTERSGLGHGAEELDLGGLGRALWRKKVMIMGLTLLAAGLAFLACVGVFAWAASESRRHAGS